MKMTLWQMNILNSKLLNLQQANSKQFQDSICILSPPLSELPKMRASTLMLYIFYQPSAHSTARTHFFVSQYTSYSKAKPLTTPPIYAQ
jgi:hypothetical protein